MKALPVLADWGAGAYAVVLAYRPLDTAANRMPGRAIGLAWIAIDPQAHPPRPLAPGACGDPCYPYGCSEQIVSRVLPLLYVNKLAKSEALGIDPDVDQRIRDDPKAVDLYAAHNHFGRQ